MIVPTNARQIEVLSLDSGHHSLFLGVFETFYELDQCLNFSYCTTKGPGLVVVVDIGKRSTADVNHVKDGIDSKVTASIKGYSQSDGDCAMKGEDGKRGQCKAEDVVSTDASQF